jgi:DNA-binding CsgD family transcriptional regulator
LVFLPNLLIRFLGIELWYSSHLLRDILHCNGGVLVPLTYGLFFLQGNTTQRRSSSFDYRSLGLAVSIVFGMAVNSVVRILFAHTPRPAAASGIYTITFVVVIVWFVSAALALKALLRSADDEPENAQNQRPRVQFGLLRLIAAAVVCYQLNAFLDTKLFPFRSEGITLLSAIPLTVVLAVTLPVFSILAGKNLNRFIRVGFPICAAFFVLAPVLLIASDSTLLFNITYTFIMVGYFMFFTTAPFAMLAWYRGRYWYYFLTVCVYLCRSFSFMGIWFFRTLASSPELSVFLSSASAALFFFLVMPIGSLLKGEKTGSAVLEAPPASERVADFFREYTLSQREAEVASLLLQGLELRKIADHLFISLPTVKSHARNIYRKFDVEDRKGFSALFFRRFRLK